MVLHYCEDDGLVVAADIGVPTDPTDYRAGSAILGCSNLRCVGCHEVVRQLVGVECPHVQTRLQRLFETPDWTTLDFVAPYSLGRLYACRCTGWLETSYHVCTDPDPEPSAGDPSLPWKCDGHPVAALPVVVDGEVIEASTDLGALVRRVLGGWSPDTSPPPSPWSPSAWLYRLRRRLADLPQAAALAEAVAACLDDPVRRGGAIAYFGGYPRDPGFERVLALATDPAELGRPSPNVVKDGSTLDYRPALALRCRLFSVRGKPDALDRAARDLLQAGLLRGDPGLETEDMDGVRSVAGPWLARHAGAIARVTPAWTIAVLQSLKDLDDPALLTVAGVALAHEPGADHAALREWLEDWPNRHEAYAAVISVALGGAAATALDGAPAAAEPTAPEAT